MIPINLEKSWIMYDVANSAFILLACSLLPIYFNDLAMDAGLTSAEYLAYWSLGASLVTFLMLIIGPMVGSLSDRRGWRKPIFMGSVIIGILACLALGIPKWWLSFLIVYIIVKIAYNASIVVYDGMLNDVTTYDRMGAVSSKAYAIGYIGSCIPFIFCLVFVLFSDMMDPEGAPISFRTAVILGIVVTSLWWLLLSLPLFKNYRQICYNEEDNVRVRGKWLMFIDTLRDIRKNPAMVLFLLAFFFYIDGVYTVMELSASYGTALGLGSVGLLAALLVTQIVAFPCTLMMSGLAKRIGICKVICISIVGYMVIALMSVVLDNLVQFFILAIFVGFFQGTIQALSRAYFGKMVPKERTGEMFGIMDVFGKGATILGTLAVSLMTMLSGEVRYVGLVLLVMFIIGLVFFVWSFRIKNYDSVTME